MTVTNEKKLTPEECFRLWEEYGTPPHIRLHCRAVAEVALAITKALNEHGTELDEELVYAAGLIHDVVRLRDRHDLEGARILKELGYAREAEIVRVHMRYEAFSPIEEVNETDMVCLGDRTIIEHTYVGVDARYQNIIDKSIRRGHPEAEAFILDKKKDVLRFIREIEERTGRTLGEITEGIRIE